MNSVVYNFIVNVWRSRLVVRKNTFFVIESEIERERKPFLSWSKALDTEICIQKLLSHDTFDCVGQWSLHIYTFSIWKKKKPEDFLATSEYWHEKTLHKTFWCFNVGKWHVKTDFIEKKSCKNQHCYWFESLNGLGIRYSD